MTTQQHVYLSPTKRITLEEFCARKAEEFTQHFKHIPLIYTPDCVLKMISTCGGEEDWPEDDEERTWCTEQICKALEASNDFELAVAQRDLEGNQMIPDDVAIPLEKLVTNTPVLEIVERGGIPEMTEYIPDPNKPMELQVVEAAQNASKASYSELKEVFSFGESMDYATPKGIVTPRDWGKLMGFSVDMAKSGAKMLMDAVAALDALGYENSVVQFASSSGLNRTTIYNYIRTARRIPAGHPARQLLPPSVLVEIATAKLHPTDEEKSREECMKIVEEAVAAGGMTCEEARSQVDLVKEANGVKRHTRVTDDSGGDCAQLRARIEELEEICAIYVKTIRGEEYLCGSLHHDLSDRHELGYPCPVVERLEAAKARFEKLVANTNP